MALVIPLAVIAVMAATDKRRPKTFVEPRHYSHDNRDKRALLAIKSLLGPERTMATSRQMFAFRTGARIPPFLSVTSRKRISAGLLTTKDILREIREHDVEMVILSARWKKRVRRQLRHDLRQMGYKKKYSDGENHNMSIWVKPMSQNTDVLK